MEDDTDLGSDCKMIYTTSENEVVPMKMKVVCIKQLSHSTFLVQLWTIYS